MNAHVSPNHSEAMLSPSKVADYVLRLEVKLGRCVDRATILPGGGIEVRMSSSDKSTNPADLVDMTE